LNYAKNLLKKNSEKKSIIFKSENGYKTALSWKNLNLNVNQVSNWMKSNGIKKGDRVAAYLPNIPETVIAYISTSTLGAVWSSCSPDFGITGVIDRFSQISPKILLVGDKYFYNGKKINILERLPEVLNKVPSINKVVEVPYPGTEIEKNKNIKIVLSDPKGSALYNRIKNGELKIEGKSITEGIGSSRVTKNFELAPIDDAYSINDHDALTVLFELLEKEGLSLGTSTGINVAGAIKLAKDLGPNHTIVTILCDKSDIYRSKMFNKKILTEKELPYPKWL